MLILSCNNIHHKLFELLPPAQTGLDFSNTIIEDDSFNIIQYLYYYNGGGVAVGDVNNDGFPDIYFSANQQPNKLFINRGMNTGDQVKFLDITDQAGVAGSGNWSTGVSMVDINADGWLDIYLCQVGGYKGFHGRNQLFINQGCPMDHSHNENCRIIFQEKAADYGLAFSGFSSQSGFFDYDLDGDLDMYLLCHSVHSSESYRDTSSTRLRDPKVGDKLFENTGLQDSILRFVEVSEKAGIYGGVAGYGLGLAIGDIDKNGYPDIYIGNDFHENDFLYLNQGNGTFQEVSNRVLGHTSYFSMGNDLADINNDGWLDLMTLDMKPENEVLFKQAQGPDPYDIYRFKRSFGYHHQFPQNSLHINQGGNNSDEVRFSENAQMMGVSATDWSWSTLMADFNLDGWKDLYITNGIPRRPNNLDYLKFISNRQIQKNASDLDMAIQMPSGEVSNYAFQNREGVQFEDQTEAWGLKRPSISHGAAYADFDLDGDLDIVVNNLNKHAFYYENTADKISNNHFLSVQLSGPENNPFGLGTRVSIYTGDHIQYQELFVTRGWQSGVDYTLTFGIGQHSNVDSALIEWPDKKTELLKDIEADHWLKIDYQNARNHKAAIDKREVHTLFNSDHQPSFRHRENEFFDNTREPLIPYLLSTQGPRLAVADVNDDQKDDFYIGGASGQVGALFVQTQAGHFIKGDSTRFQNEEGCEDTGLAFFDADGDGDQDLYIGSGGNQFYEDPDKLKDRLYLNDGSGGFTLEKDALPAIYAQTSCVKPFDFDADGDVDLFVGSRSVPLFYGRSPNSYLMLNDGSGHFKLADKEIIDLTALGMVTDAIWADTDNDGKKDLVVVGDWMPVTIFKNNQSEFSKSGTGESTLGWWNTLASADLDADGDQDLILGNLGLNSNLQASENQPLQLYIDDFDANFTPDPVITYFKQGREYPLLGLDILGSQMVFLKKKFRSYNQFAEKTIDEVFTYEQLQKAVRKKVTELRSMMAINDGTGNFSFQPLPNEAQHSSVNSILILDINRDQHQDILLGGNFYDLQPAIGRMDASYGTLLLGDENASFSVVPNRESNLFLEGQIRDLEIIEVNQNKILLVARNDSPLQFIQLSEEL